MSFGTYKLLVIAGVVLLALVFATTFARGAEQCEVNVAAYTTQAKQLQDQGTDIKVSAMEGQELKAFESVVKTEVGQFELEAGTVAIYFFEVVGQGMTVVVEVSADGCVLHAAQGPTELLKVFLSKMSAAIDKGKA